MSEEKKERILQDIIRLNNKSPAASHPSPIKPQTPVKIGQVAPMGYGFMSNMQGQEQEKKNTPKEQESASSSSLIPSFVKKNPSIKDDIKVPEKPKLPPKLEAKKEGSRSAPPQPFPDPAAMPTQEGDFGIRYDFNFGIRFYLPKGKGKWRARMFDLDTQIWIYALEGEDLHVASKKRHFIRARIEFEQEGKLVWSHDYDAKGKIVAVIFPAGTVGDTLGWFPYAYRFGQKHQAKLHVVMSKHMKELMAPVYPDVVFHERDDFDKNEELKKSLYATYYLGLFFHDKENIWQPSDFRLVGLHRTAGHILGVDPTEEPPKILIEKEDERPIEEPYVVIAAQASSACKLWNNPVGWIETVAYLKSIGYRVICIDLNPVIGNISSWNAIPHGVEDETGSRPLSERARWIKHADFFVGLSSGLSWLAWAVGTPIVMISGFTHPSNEFANPYRVFSTYGCNSCWHDVAHPFKHDDYLFCPHHKGTPRHFECTRSISSGYVIETIKRLCQDFNYLPLKERVKECVEGKDKMKVTSKNKRKGKKIS